MIEIWKDVANFNTSSQKTWRSNKDDLKEKLVFWRRDDGKMKSRSNKSCLKGWKKNPENQTLTESSTTTIILTKDEKNTVLLIFKMPDWKETNITFKDSKLEKSEGKNRKSQ